MTMGGTGWRRSAPFSVRTAASDPE